MPNPKKISKLDAGILAFLAAGSLSKNAKTVSEIAVRIGADRAAVAATATKLAKAGLLRKHPTEGEAKDCGYWRSRQLRFVTAGEIADAVRLDTSDLGGILEGQIAGLLGDITMDELRQKVRDSGQLLGAKAMRAAGLRA